MKISAETPRRRSPFIALAPLAILVLAITVSCSDDGDSTPHGNTGQSPAVNQRTVKPGDAGIPSKPRQLKGLDGVFDPLDDGIAMWKTRPANEDRTGVTADTIKLGRLFPTSLPQFAGTEGTFQGLVKSLLNRINEAGGVHGRKLELITADDGFNPSVAVTAMKKLVEEDKVFGFFYTGGCPSCAEANTPYLAEKGIPMIAGICAQQFLEPATKAPCFPYNWPREVAGVVYDDVIKKAYPDARRVAFIYDTATAEDKGFRWRAAQNGHEVVMTAGFERSQLDIASQVQQAVAAKADVIAFNGLTQQNLSLHRTLRETLGSKIPVVQFETTGLPLPLDPQWDKFLDGEIQISFFGGPNVFGANSPKVTAWPKIAAEDGWRYSPAGSQIQSLEILVRALELAGPDLTRQGVIQALEEGFDGAWQCTNCLAPPVFGAQDHWFIEGVYLSRWNASKKDFEPALGSYEASVISWETSQGKGLRGNYPGFECQPASAQLPKGTCPWRGN